MRTFAIYFSFLLILSYPLCLAADGRIEINQASVDAAGGFPFTISASGNYVLTGDLTVTSDVTALMITVDDVTIDLNGFQYHRHPFVHS